MFKSVAGSILLRLKQAADAYDAKLAESRCAAHVRLGRFSSVDYRKLSFKPSSLLQIGDNSMFAAECYFDRANAKVEVGSRTYVHGVINCAQRIVIGDDVLISSGGNISDHDSHALDFAERECDVVDYLAGRKDWSHVSITTVIIERRAWIGYGAIILKGVIIGEGAVIGAGSVVTRNVPPYTVAAGNPARVIRTLTMKTSRSLTCKIL